jgi:CheY-like chemotaxis protein/HPt (histidine-containing phosphotransfer) domain-containing protein
MAADQQDGAEALDGLRVVYADDNATSRALATAFLGSLGVTAEPAGSGAEAVAIAAGAEAGRHAAVFVDVDMAARDAIGAIARITGSEGAPPVVAVIGRDAGDELLTSAEAGACGHLAKPLTRERLAKALSEAVRRSRRPASASSARLSAGDGEIDLSRLTTIDAAALVEMLGDRAFIARLLLQFRDGETGLADQIDAALAADDVAEARRLAHRLKGVSGNLRAAAVFAAATALEKAASPAAPGAGAALAPLAAALREALARVAEDIDAARRRSAPPREAARIPPLTAPNLATRLSHLANLLDACDLTAEDVWLDLAGAMRAHDAAAASAMDEAIEALRYADARMIALNLIRELSA